MIKRLVRWRYPDQTDSWIDGYIAVWRWLILTILLMVIAAFLGGLIGWTMMFR
jgi:hypothetical protein